MIRFTGEVFFSLASLPSLSRCPDHQPSRHVCPCISTGAIDYLSVKRGPNVQRHWPRDPFLGNQADRRLDTTTSVKKSMIHTVWPHVAIIAATKLGFGVKKPTTFSSTRHSRRHPTLLDRILRGTRQWFSGPPAVCGAQKIQGGFSLTQKLATP